MVPPICILIGMKTVHNVYYHWQWYETPPFVCNKHIHHWQWYETGPFSITKNVYCLVYWHETCAQRAILVQIPSRKDPFARRSGILQRCVGFITFVIFFTPSCRLFIPLEFISYPNELFSYLVQDFHTNLVWLKKYGMKLSGSRRSRVRRHRHTGLGSSSIIAHVLHSPPPPPPRTAL